MVCSLSNHQGALPQGGHLRARDLHVAPAPGQALPQALRSRGAQLPPQLSAAPLFGRQDLAQGDNFLFYLHKHKVDMINYTITGSD